MKLAEKILNALESEKFYQWHESGDFGQYIRGEDFAPTKEEILKQIQKMFGLPEET